MGALHGAYDGISSGTGAGAIPSLQQVTTVGNTTTLPILKDPTTSGNNIDYFISTVGNDANDGLTALTPFLTIQHFLKVVSAGVFNGMVTLNFADGTYAQGATTVEIKQILGAAPTTPGYPSSIIRFLGNVANQALVKITFTGAGIGIGLRGPSALIVDHLTVNGDGTAGSRAFNCSDNSRLIWRSIDVSGVSFAIAAGGSSIVSHEAGTYNVVAAGIGFSITDNARLTSFVTTMNLSGFSTHGYLTSTLANIAISGPGTYNITGNTAVGGAFQNTNGGIIGLGSGVTYNIAGMDGAGGCGIRLINGSSTTIGGQSNIYNLTNCSVPINISENACFISIGSGALVPVFNYLGTTPNTVQVIDSGNYFTADSFSGATIVKTQANSAAGVYGIALDNRYPRVFTANISGLIPQNATVFMTAQNPQLTYLPTGVATENCTITSFGVVSQTGNGLVATDTYTIFKNGVATGMTFNIANGTTGSTSANQVSLVAGDTFAIQLVSDPIASGASDLIGQIIVEKL